MILRRFNIRSTSFAPSSKRIIYKQSTFHKILHFIQNILNKMSNQEARSFSERISENVNKNVPIKQERPKNQLEAEKRFTDEQHALSKHQQNRLKRIDEILGTQTYFHETKVYEQRIDSENVLKLSKLYSKYKQKDRFQLDFLNPQIPKLLFQKRKRKVTKWMKKLRTYPKGNSDLQNFSQHKLQDEKQVVNDQLIKFLSQEVLFTRLSLSELELTIESINKQKIIADVEGCLLDEQLDENKIVMNGYTYFKPSHLMSIYRIQNSKYSNKLMASIDSFVEAIANNEGYIQQIISLDEIYECLKNYYFDSRVNEYLAKIQNKQLNYFFSDLQISPDGNCAFMIIDLLGTKKQYVGIYKSINKAQFQNQPILPQNIVFNFKPEVALRNNGQLYYIQRNQQGLYIELVKTKFAKLSSWKKFQQSKEQKEGNQILQNANIINNIKRNRREQVLYKCKPYEQLRIISGKEAKVSTEKYSLTSSNFLIEEREGDTKLNNRIYLVTHGKGEFNMQLLTANNERLTRLLEQAKKNNISSLQNCQKNPKLIHTDCMEIMGVGYVLVRYQQAGSQLKYGNSRQFTKYATLVPYTKTNFHTEDFSSSKIQQISTTKVQQIESKESAQSKSKEERKMLVSPENKVKQGVMVKVELPSQQSISFMEERPADDYILDLERQKIIFACNEEQFIDNLMVLHSSLSNVYLLANKSIQFAYNRHSLHVQPLRSNVAPYSLYLDGFPIEILSLNHQNRLNLKVMAPLWPVALEYTFWKKEMLEKSKKKLYIQNIVIREEEEGGEVRIKVLANHNFIKSCKQNYQQSQPVILYLPSSNQRLDELQLQKLLEKGVIFVQIIKCRGLFGTNAFDFLRGSKKLFNNYVDDIRFTINFAKQHIGSSIGVYAEGPSSCFATLLLNIKQNQFNQLFDCSVLHQGIYDFKDNQIEISEFFKSDLQFIQEINPYNMPMYDPTRSNQPTENVQKQTQYKINNLQNILFSTLSHKSKAQSRKFINKLRVHNKIIYENVFLKEFDILQEKDIFNLAYLFKVMKDLMNQNYNQTQKEKYKQINQKGQSLSRDWKDKNRNKQEETS